MEIGDCIVYSVFYNFGLLYRMEWERDFLVLEYDSA